MRVFMLLETALKSIRKNKRRSLLTMVGLVIGTAAVITILSVGRGYEQHQRNQLLPDSDGDTIQTTVTFTPADAGFENTNLAHFAESDISMIKQIEGVVGVEYEKVDPAKIYRNQAIKIRDYGKSTRMQLVLAEGRDVIHGRAISVQDSTNQNKVVTIADELAEEVTESKDVAHLVGETIKIGSETLQIVGIYRTEIGETVMAQMPNTSYEYYFGISKPTNLTVTISNQYSSSLMGKKIVEVLAENGSVHELGTYSNSSSAAMVDSLSSLFRSLTLLISFVGAISLFISGVGVMNMIYTSVSERVKEIGVRRALGATEGSIQMQFLFEGLTLTFIGGIIGYMIGLLMAKGISLMMRFDFIPDLFTAGLAIIISVLIGVIFSYFPSKSATEKDIVELVR